jgi:2-dehydro-3-deoxyphosphogluconate aldolase / (4S)-4-hydroxy-2-oxoglutarate aldolase
MTADLRGVLAQDRVMAILRYRDGGDVSTAVSALADGGVRVLEVTVDTPGSWPAIEKHAARRELFVGAGTVTTREEARRVADLGGSFIVSPGFDPEVVEAAGDCGLACFPGVMTGSEVLAARRCGADYLKLFPAGALGTAYLSQLRGPFPDEAFVPTGGIAIEDAASWLQAGAFAVALGSDLAGRTPPTSAAQAAELVRRAERALRQTRREEPAP